MTGATLDRLVSLSKSLNQASDLLSKQIAEAEAALNGLRIGIWAWVLIHRFQESPTATGALMLGYGKREGKWGILLSREYDDFPDEPDVSFLRDAPRLEKLAAVEKLPALIRALEEQAEKVADEANKKAASVKELTTALQKLAN